MHGAYDFLESPQVASHELTVAAGRAAAKRCSALPFFYVAVDGSSLMLPDGQCNKGFGCIGASSSSARGLKVISALAVDPSGTTQGLLTQVWWSRARQASKTVGQRRKLRVEQKETQRWLDAIADVKLRCNEHGATPWFVLDREADARPILLALHETKHPFTVRASWDRVVQAAGRDQQYLRAALGAQEPLGSFEVEVPSRANRQQRTARMAVRAMSLTVQPCRPSQMRQETDVAADDGRLGARRGHHASE